MVDQTTLARVNLNALLRTLEDLPSHDSQAKDIADGKRETIQFSVGGVGAARLAIGGNTIAHATELLVPQKLGLPAVLGPTGARLLPG